MQLKETVTKLQNKVKHQQAKSLQEFQKQILKQLYELRAILHKDIKNAQNKIQQTPITSTKQCKTDERQLKIALLQQQNQKLKYRIQHLSRNLKQKLQI